MTERLSLIAGSGALVPAVVEAARSRGYAVQVLAVGRVARGVAATSMTLSEPQRLVDAVRSFGSTLVAMAGGVSLNDQSRRALVAFFDAGEEALSGDGGLSHLALRLTELTGARVIGVHEIAPDLLAPHGLIGGPDPGEAGHLRAETALSLAKRAGTVDLGQALVVSGGRVIASEDIAGTDALLWRVRLLKFRGAITGGPDLVLAKAAKPGQPHYVDLPAIGPVTIRNARRAGIGLVAIEAGATLVIERVKLAALADALGVSVVGTEARVG